MAVKAEGTMKMEGTTVPIAAAAAAAAAGLMTGRPTGKRDAVMHLIAYP